MKKIKLNLHDLEMNYETLGPEEIGSIKGGDAFTDWFNNADEGVYTFTGGYADDPGLANAYSSFSAYGGGSYGYGSSTLGNYGYMDSETRYYLNKNTQQLVFSSAAGGYNGNSIYAPLRYSGTDNEVTFLAETVSNAVKLVYNGIAWTFEKIFK